MAMGLLLTMILSGGIYYWWVSGDSNPVDENVVIIEAYRLLTEMNNVYTAETDKEKQKVLNKVFYEPELFKVNDAYNLEDLESVESEFNETTLTLGDSWYDPHMVTTQIRQTFTKKDGTNKSKTSRVTIQLKKYKDGEYKIVDMYAPRGEK